MTAPGKDLLAAAIRSLTDAQRSELLAFLVGYSPASVDVALGAVLGGATRAYEVATGSPDNQPKPTDVDGPPITGADLVGRRVINRADQRDQPLIGQVVAALAPYRVRVVWGSIVDDHDVGDLYPAPGNGSQPTPTIPTPPHPADLERLVDDIEARTRTTPGRS